jgi:hypothetical protein
MGNGQGLVNCPDQTFDYNTLISSNTVKAPSCSVCPANLYNNCTSLFGPEWGNDTSLAEGSGCRLQCSRVGHSVTDPNICCLGTQPPGYPKSTCDPTLVPGSTGCVETMYSWCTQNETNMVDPKCTSLHEYPQIMTRYCNSIDKITNSQLCRAYLSTPEAGGNIDTTMVQYCNKAPTDSLCCFIKSTIPCPNKFDTRCTGVPAYQTSSMVSTVCPDVLTCNQYISLSPGAKAYATKFDQSCLGNKNTTPTQPSTPAAVAGGPSITPTAIIVVGTIAAILFLLSRGDEETKSGEQKNK